MKKTGLIVLGLLMTVISFGQSYDATIQYDKKKQ